MHSNTQILFLANWNAVFWYLSKELMTFCFLRSACVKAIRVILLKFSLCERTNRSILCPQPGVSPALQMHSQVAVYIPAGALEQTRFFGPEFDFCLSLISQRHLARTSQLGVSITEAPTLTWTNQKKFYGSNGWHGSRACVFECLPFGSIKWPNCPAKTCLRPSLLLVCSACRYASPSYRWGGWIRKMAAKSDALLIWWFGAWYGSTSSLIKYAVIDLPHI